MYIKKGFTVVESTIVLIIIGLLMVFAIKGKDLLIVAKVRQEHVSINKISTAVNTYALKNNRKFPRRGGNTASENIRKFIDYEPFFAGGYLDRKDIASKIGDYNFYILNVKENPTGGYISDTGILRQLALTTSNNYDQGTSFVSDRNYCIYETIIFDDDRNFNTGKIRKYFSSPALSMTSPKDYDDCYKLSKTPKTKVIIPLYSVY